MIPSFQNGYHLASSWETFYMIMFNWLSRNKALHSPRKEGISNCFMLSPSSPFFFVQGKAVEHMYQIREAEEKKLGKI